MDKKVGSIRDVARETGLSTATISRVMNGAKNVSPDTRAKVLLASKKLDYLPNPAARTLTTKKSKTIAAIIPTIEHSVFAKYIAAIEQELSERGYSLVLAISNSDADQELEAAEKLLGMGAEAFILSGANHSIDLINLFDRRNVPCVFTSIWDPENIKPTIGYDNFLLAKNAINFLHEKGHEHIAILHGPADLSDRTRERRNGAKAAILEKGSLTFFETELSVAGGKDAIFSALNGDRSAFSAVLCFSDVLALGVYAGLSERGLSVPDDISIMGFDNLDWSAHITPSLTTINLPARKMGQTVAASLMDHLDSNEPLRAHFLEGQIIERQSVKNI